MFNHKSQLWSRNSQILMVWCVDGESNSTAVAASFCLFVFYFYFRANFSSVLNVLFLLAIRSWYCYALPDPHIIISVAFCPSHTRAHHQGEAALSAEGMKDDGLPRSQSQPDTLRPLGGLQRTVLCWKPGTCSSPSSRLGAPQPLLTTSSWPGMLLGPVACVQPGLPKQHQDCRRTCEWPPSPPLSQCAGCRRREGSLTLTLSQLLF